MYIFGILLAVFVLGSLLMGLIRRRQENGDWVKEERREESGHWIEKRSGERGTYGSLDREMEDDRISISRQSKVLDLSNLIRTFFAANYTIAHTTPISASYLKGKAGEIIAVAEKILDRTASIGMDSMPNLDDEDVVLLQKELLNFMYDTYPRLLDCDLGSIKYFDAKVGMIALELADKFVANR